MCGACLLGNRNYVEQVRENLVVGDARLLVRLLDCLVACFLSSEFSAGLINHTNAGLEITKYANLYHIIFRQPHAHV